MSRLSDSVLESKYKPNDSKFDSISRYLFESLLTNAQKELIHDHTSGTTLNGQQIVELCRSVAQSLTDNYEAKSGDLFCLLCPNHYFQSIALISIWSFGGVALVLSDATTYGEIEAILKQTQFKYLFCGKNNENIGAKLASNFPQICRKVFTTNEVNSETNATNIAQLMNYKSEDKDWSFRGNATDVALIEVTAGTTDGTRKLVNKTHSNLISGICQMQNTDVLTDSDEDTVMSVPFDKLFGVSFFLNSLTAGAKTVIVEGTLAANAATYLECIERCKVTKLVAFAPDIEMLVNTEVNLMYNISSIKEIIHLGVFHEYNLLRQRVDNMFRCRYFRGVYGTTESGIISCLYRSKAFERNCYSVGKLIPGTQVKIVDVSTDAALPAYGIGEICVKSRQLSPGYCSDKFNDSYTKDGFFRTGDCGYFDNDDNLYAECRLADIVGIEDQIYLPNDLEILLLSHPNVSEVKVVATFEEYSDSDDDHHENNQSNTQKKNKINNTFKIFVVLKPGSEINDLDLINYVNDRVEPIRQIDSGLFIVDVLPRNCMGAIKRSALVQF